MFVFKLVAMILFLPVSLIYELARIFESKSIKAFRLYRQSHYGIYEMTREANEQGSRASATLRLRVLPRLSEREMAEYTHMKELFDSLLNETMDAHDELALARLFATPVGAFRPR